MKGSRRIELRGDGNALVCLQQKGQTNSFSVPLRVLNPSPSRISSSGFKYLPAIIIFLLFTAWAGACMVVPGHDGDNGGRIILGSIVGCIFGFLLAASLVKFWQERFDLALFHNRHNGTVVFNLLHGLPDPKSYDQFVGELARQATEAQQDEQAIPGGMSIPGQIQMFSRLRDQNVITPEEFERIKSSLLEPLHRSKQIGFAVGQAS